PKDLLQGGLVPGIRHSAAEIGDGAMAIAVGDAHATVDPILGQGANIASHSAWVLGEEIVKADAFDRAFVERVDHRRMDRVLGAQRWTNMMLAPPSPERGALIAAMSQNPALADEFTENFNYPERQWARLSSPESIQAWIAEKS
ncbi:MAG TPA: monooxygenase, partial [Alphaproteobacteria bacterium]|nr:monooxygenase [Alphaproteobacteria bacterium]